MLSTRYAWTSVPRTDLSELGHTPDDLALDGLSSRLGSIVVLLPHVLEPRELYGSPRSVLLAILDSERVVHQNHAQ